LQCAADFDSIGILFGAVPLLFEGWRRTEIWIDLLRRLDEFEARAGPDALHLHRVLRARIKLALRDYRGYLHEVRRLDGMENLGELGNTVRAVAAALEDPNFADFSKRKIFGIGLSKTGTTTLAAALTILGMNTLHWTNPLTCELISDDDLHLFDALTDTPVCKAFEKYYYMFPAAKFIYTMRPLDSWIDSMNRHWRRALNICEFEEFQLQVRAPHTFRFGSEFCGIHQVLYLSHADLRHAHEAYDQRVRRFFSDKPQDRFLAFNVFDGHGWPELCAFLGTKVPALLPFPCENKSAATAAGRP
jgi:sulfotransferase family protein